MLIILVLSINALLAQYARKRPYKISLFLNDWASLELFILQGIHGITKLFDLLKCVPVVSSNVVKYFGCHKRIALNI